MTIELMEKAPPGWAGTVKAMKKHMPPERAFALAWSMFKKGAEPHYRALPSTKSKKEPELKKKYQKEGSDFAAEIREIIGTEESREDGEFSQEQVIEMAEAFDRVQAGEGQDGDEELAEFYGVMAGLTEDVYMGAKASPKDVARYKRMNSSVQKRERERLLDEIDAWESGKKGTVGQPSTGQQYGPVMVQKRKELLGLLKALDTATGRMKEDWDGLFEEELLIEKAHHYFDGKNYYADTAFLNAIGDAMPGMSLDHMGFGEFELTGNGKRIEFDRMRGKDFKGQSGRSHKVYDNKGGKLVKELIKAMEKKNKSELVKEEVELTGNGIKPALSIASRLEAALTETRTEEDRVDVLYSEDSLDAVLEYPEALDEDIERDDVDELLERAGKSQSVALSPEEFTSDNPMLKRELQRSVDQTRKFVRSIYHLEDVAADLYIAAKETERIRRTTGVERAMRRSPLGNVTRSFEAEVKQVYNGFAEGRNSMMDVAKMARISTRRAGKRKGSSKPTGEITATNLVRHVLHIAAKMGASIREAGELGSVALREMEKLLNQKSVIGGDKLYDRLSAIVQVYLDFRDQVSQGLFKMIASVVRRMNEITRRLMKMNEEIEVLYIIELDWLDEFEDYDPDAELLSEGKTWEQVVNG